MATLTLYRSLYAFIFVSFLVLPTVARSIFRTRQCESFGHDDATGERRSYLLADLTVRCSDADPVFARLHVYFIGFFVLWPVLVPLLFLGLVLRVTPYVRKHRITRLASACRFLWRDYDDSSLWWETADMMRKVFLTSIILFVDVEYGSSRLLRLLLASIVSAVYLAALALARPYKRSDDLYLACTSNMLLTCCFVSGFAIKLCEQGRWKDSCEAFMGITDSYQATAFVVLLSVAMLIVSSLIILYKVTVAITTPTIRLVSSGREPLLDLPASCQYHAFVSHVWGTGQDQTHTIVRQLKLLMPDIRIWLDVDNLDDIGKLEDYVRQSAVIVIFLSQGYFRYAEAASTHPLRTRPRPGPLSPHPTPFRSSANCRRELYTTLQLRKPMVVVREADAEKGGQSIYEHIAECRLACIDEKPSAYPEYTGPEEVIKALFSEEPILWVRASGFQLESVKMTALRMLRCLPYYTSSPQQLAKGIKVQGQVKPHVLNSNVRLLISEANEGAEQAAAAVVAAAKAAPGRARVVLGSAELALPPEGGCLPELTTMLVYLNNRTFLDGRDTLCHLVQQALDANVTLILLHEQDPARGGGSIREIIVQTPEVLRLPPYQLYNTLAIPLFNSPEHHNVSMWKTLTAIGAATSPQARPFAKHSDPVPTFAKTMFKLYQGAPRTNVAVAAFTADLDPVVPGPELSDHPNVEGEPSSDGARV